MEITREHDGGGGGGDRDREHGHGHDDLGKPLAMFFKFKISVKSQSREFREKQGTTGSGPSGMQVGGTGLFYISAPVILYWKMIEVEDYPIRTKSCANLLKLLRFSLFL